MTNKKPMDGVLSYQEQVYTVWSVYAPKQIAPKKLIVMNNTTAQIHSIWDDLLEARKTALMLNKALIAEKAAKEKADKEAEEYLAALAYSDKDL